MKGKIILILTLLLNISCSFAVTEAEVQEAVNVQGKEVISGNLFIWFLCALAFLKVSQKVDSILSTLGISVSKTGSSLLGETMMVTKAIIGSSKKIGNTVANAGMKFSGTSKLGMMAGGLGFIEKKFGNSVASELVSSDNRTSITGFGAKMYSATLGEQGGFASKVIGSIAHGKIGENGVIKGEKAIEAFSSYMPQLQNSMNIANSSNLNIDASSGDTVNADEIFDNPSFSDVYSNIEIGGGRISGYENIGNESREFIMYSSEKYLKPEGEFQTITSADGANWYKQYAEPTIKKVPLSEEDGRVSYIEKIEHKLPKTPGLIDRS